MLDFGNYSRVKVYAGHTRHIRDRSGKKAGQRFGQPWHREMGTGTDVAIESADMALLQGSLRGMVRARKLSQATMRNIRQNLFFAFIYNVAGVPLAAGILYPFFGILLIRLGH
jgi:hypothetical protein